MLEPLQFRKSPRSDCCEPDSRTPESAVSLNLLDSRAIGRASCFAQRFMRPGTYLYNVVPGYGQALCTEHPFKIVVAKEKNAEMAQHNVLVLDAPRGFDVDRPEIAVKTGDMVLWSGNGRTSSAFAVVGDQEFFNSHRMVNECGYTHAFGTPGTYKWRDAFGSGLGGEINVREVVASDAKALAKWTKQLEEGSLVMIQDGKVDKKKLDIVIGQTVFFAIVTGPGISITDERLLQLTAPQAKAGKKAA